MTDVEATEVKPKGKCGRPARVNHQVVIDDFKANMTKSDIAKKHACSVVNIHAILKRNGVSK